jgi:hypothetical protein
MSIAEEFESKLPLALDALEEDEWAVTSLRERICATASGADAFENIVPVAAVASRQTDAYAFCSCCWLICDLARISETTEEPAGLRSSVVALQAAAERFDVQPEVEKIGAWYRFSPNNSFNPDALKRAG